VEVDVEKEADRIGGHVLFYAKSLVVIPHHLSTAATIPQDRSGSL